MSTIRTEMPVLARHQGEWVGSYTLVDREGKVVDRYDSHLICQFPTDSVYPYYQTNRYEWADGKREEYEFPGTYHDRKLWFDTDRMAGHAWEADHAIVMLWFAYKTVPDAYLYEMIHISPCNNYRSRTWHWFKNHQLWQRTLIQEERLR